MSVAATLALNGGAPARARPDTERVMRLGATQIGGEELAAVEAVLRRQILYRYHGSTVDELEERFGRWLGDGARTLAVSSGTAAIQLAFAALDLQPGYEVLVPSIGFVSAATAIHSAGGVPRFVPVDRSLGIDPAAAMVAVTDRTRAVLAVHPYGSPCDIAGVLSLARGVDVVVVEDVAQCCGGTFAGRRLGTFGAAAAFSFQHFKLLTTGEGGMVATGDATVHDRATFLHDAAAIWARPDASSRVGSVRIAPLNLRMSEIEGALGLVQLDRCDRSIARLRSAMAPLRSYLAEVSGLTLRALPDPAGEIATNLVFFLGDRAEAAWVVEALRAEGVNASLLLSDPPGGNRHWAGDWIPVLERCGMPLPDGDVIEADRRLLDPGVVLPLDIRYSEEDIAETLAALRKVLAG
jgi:8-amino-3,8-dideoxy-alpha-D-manno-octulosonate transaminase